MFKGRILMITDHKWRDLAGNVYLKCLLEKKYSFDVKLCNLGDETFWSLYYKPHIVVFNNMFGRKRIAFAKWLKEKGVGIIVLPTEGMLREMVEIEMLAGKYSDFSPIDLYLSWNRPIADKIIELGTLPSERVKVVGVPRFDYYYPPLNKLWKAKEEIQKGYNLEVDHKKPIVLCTSNFTYAKFKDRNRDFMYKDWKDLGVVHVWGDKEAIDRIIEIDYQARNMLIDALDRLLQEVPGIQLIYKPHPAEEKDFYEATSKMLMRKYPGRVAFVSREYIWNLLSISNVLLQRSCTTGVEAWILDKPTLQVMLHPEEFYTSEERERCSDRVTSYGELKEKILYYLNGGEIPAELKRNRDEYLEKWCYVLDGKRTEATAEVIDEFFNSRGQDDPSIKFVEEIDRLAYETAKFSYKLLRDNTLSRLKGTDKLGRMDKKFKKTDEMQWERQILKVLDGRD